MSWIRSCSASTTSISDARRVVIVIGGGIGGLATALCLHACGIPARVFERVNAIKPLGVGINLLPHAVAILHELGLGDALAAAAIQTSRLQYYNKLGQQIWSEPRGVAAGYPVPQYSIHRGTLHLLLYQTVLERLGANSVQLGASFVSADQRAETVLARFQQAPEASGALLIGADGIHSTVRASFYPNEGPPRFAGRLLWRASVEGTPFLDGRTMIMAGHQDQKFVCYPICAEHARGGRALINWVAELNVEGDAPPQDWNRQVDRSRFAEQFANWRFDWLDVPALIEAANPIYEFPLADRDPLPQWTRGRVTLLGDAAHPMYPIGSNGASQAILDAHALAHALAQHGEVAQALQAYEAARRPATTAIVLANRGNGPEQVMQLAEERAPHGFQDIDAVIPRHELEAIAARYKQTAGFSVAQVQRQNVPP
jgi:2-polyprenyl-6-methoxyphenol hydroxylase-like FAD-dependent oxidoreductase